MKHHRLTSLVLVTVVSAACWQLAQSVWIPAKAVVAQILLEHAWRQAQEYGGNIRPWPRADTWPVARLVAPELGIDRIVLAGDSGATLAFGPGLSYNGARPDEPGTVVISGHRDTHFRFLQQLSAGDHLVLQTRNAEVVYAVRDSMIIDTRDYHPIPDQTGELLLVTCYPFDAVLAGGPLRYLVHANTVPASQSGT